MEINFGSIAKVALDIAGKTDKAKDVAGGTPLNSVFTAVGKAGGDKPNLLSAAGAAASGATTGATIGSIIPGIGTAIGAVAGGVIGFFGKLFGKEEAA